uniref:ATP binding cassette subfamily A member 13 n=1 Tax=Anas platyrhynchos platyrhynchos TaxID=8840 RepID=A0A493TEE3_ANAPP
MGHAVHQFKALFWKNWLCRVRQPVLSLAEILWPCVLFLVLAAIRFQEPPKYKESCYLEARDLPSRGLYPFMRTLFCNVGSRCRNTTEEMISRVENLYKQPSFWNLLHSLPHLELNNTEDGLAECCKQILFYIFLSGFQYNISLGAVLWNPRAVRAELESRFGFDDLHVKKLLSYTAQLTKIPTGETLDQFVCSALSSVPGDEADKENNEERCISTWHETKLYLVHSVSKLKLYAQVHFNENLTSVKEFWKTEDNLWISGEKEMDHLEEVIEEMIMPDFSALSSLQSLMETVLNNTIIWMKNFAEGEESATNFSLALSDLHNELQKNFQALQRSWMKEKTDIFWHIVKIISLELDSMLSHISQLEEEEVLETLSRFIFSATENKKNLNGSMLLFKNILTDWPDFNVTTLNRLEHLSENFRKNLYEVGSLTESHTNASFSTVHGRHNASSSLFSNETFIYKVQELGEIVPNFFKDIQKLNSITVDSIFQILFSLYQNTDLLLNIYNNTLFEFLYKTSKDISSFQAWHDLQDMDRVSDFLFETFDLLWNFTSKSLCEKLQTFYNYTEFQAQSLAQEGKKEMQIVYNTLSSLKTLLMDEELETAAFCYLEQFFDFSLECLVNSGCIDFYLSNITSLNHSAEVYNLLLLPLDSVLFNKTNLGDDVSVPSALHCTFTWLQTWTEIFEEASKILNLNSTFFVYLRNDLEDLSESLLNTTHIDLCNKTDMAIVEATTAMHLLKIIVEGGDLNDWKDFEAFLAILQSVFENAINATSSLKGNSLDDILEMIGIMIIELQQSILKVVNGDFLNSWLDASILEGSGGKEMGSSVFSIGNSLSAILKLSPKELEFVLTEIKDTADFLRNVPQGKYLACVSIFKNMTKLILDNTLKDLNYSQMKFSSHLHVFLNSYSIVDGVEDCNGWIRGFSNLSEKYKSASHLENAKHVLFLLESLGNTETDTKLMNMIDFVNLVFNLILPECSVTSSDVICVSVYFNVIAKTLKLILPEFHIQDDTSALEFIFTLLNNSGRLIKTAVNSLMGYSHYTSNDTHFNLSVHESNRTLRMFLKPFHQVLLSSKEILAEIKTLLKNETFEIQENISLLDIEIDEKNIGFWMEFFQDVISRLDSNLSHELQGDNNTFLQTLIEKVSVNAELLKKALKIFKSSTTTAFPIRNDKEFLEHVVTLVQNLKSMDIEFLIGQFKQVQRSLDNFFKNVKPLHIESSELGLLIDWWDAFENNSCNWNLTTLWQITRLFQAEELSDVEEMFHFLLDVINLTERLAHRNITEALAEVYAFVLTQEAKMPMFTKEEFSNQVESLLMLLETLTDMPDEPADVSVCFSAAFCWALTTVTPRSDPTFKPCDFAQTNFSLNYNAIFYAIKEMKLVTVNDNSLCTLEDFQTDITHNLTCFFHQIKEWNSILLKFSELHRVNGSVLKELQDFWDELFLYAVPLQANDTNSGNCSSTLKRQVALQVIEILSNIQVEEMEMAEDVLEWLDNLYGGLNWNRHSRISLIKTVLTNVKNVTSEVSELLDAEAVLSFLSIVQPLMAMSSVGSQAYSKLMVLAALNDNSNISDNIENIWLPIVKSIEDLLVNFNVRHLLAVIEKEFQLLKVTNGQSSSKTLHVFTQQFNISSVEAMLRNFEDIQQIVNSFMCECNNKNYSKIMKTLILLMTNENSSDLLLFVENVVDFLELFQNKSKGDYTGMLFDGHLDRKISNNTYIANSVLQSSLLHMISDFAITEEAWHANNTELQIVDLINSFFYYAQYGKVSTLSQKRTLEILQEILQMIFPSFAEHDRNKTPFLLKDLHEDIMAEMRASKICQILQESLHPASVQLLHKLQFLWTFSLAEEPAVTSNLFCVVTKCKDDIMSHLLVSVIEGINLVQDHYQRWLQSVGNLDRYCWHCFSSLPGMKVKDCVQNITELRLDILSSVNISEETFSTILDASISCSKVFYSAFVGALTGTCDEEVLSLLLKLPENNKTSLAVEELCSLPALDMYTMFVLIIQNLNLRHIIYTIPSEMGDVLSTLLDVVSSISSLLNKVQHIMENLPVFLQAIQNTGVLDTLQQVCFLQGGQFRSSAAGSLESVIKAVCREESSFFSNANLFIDMPRITGLLEDNMAKYGIPEDSTPFCLKLYREILQSSNGALVWTFLKPLLHGKILYNSNINMIDLVIEKVNIKRNTISEALQNNFVKHFVESNLDIDMEKLFQKMQVYEIMMDKMLNSSASKQIDLLSHLIVNISSCVLLDRFQPFESVDKLEEKAHELMQQNNFLASIIFNAPKNKTPDFGNLLPWHISYTIRTSVLYSMRTDLIKNPVWKSHPQKLPADGFKYNHIFIPIQDMIERAIISVQTGSDISEPAIQVQAMPYPCHTSDLFLNNIGFFFPLMMMLTWMVSVAGMVRKLVYEREIHLEEYMKTMGVHPAIHFFAWFLENLIVLTISSSALAIILKASGIFAYSNGFLIFLFLLDFGVTVIMLSYFLGAFFSSANTAALCASLVYMISFLPYIVLLVLQNQLSFIKQIIMCLLSTTAFGQGVFFITFFEGQEIGIQWNNVYQPLAQGGYMTFGLTCWMMLFDSILYSIGGWYFSNIVPGKIIGFILYGFEAFIEELLNATNRFDFSYLPPGWKGACTEGATIGVVLLSLTKEHVDGQKAAVKDLSLTFHRGQITALLGPNGAGKTTVISLLTGLYPPSSGTIIINGKDIRTDLATIRTELGVCPQYDVLFNILTVREHLLLYGSVKAPDWTNKQLNQQVTLEDVDLLEHQDKHVGALSGGMKRRLSVAISFIGNSKTVILDEPTSGVDPCSRRSIWDVLLKYKAGCTLIFTTHHLDEAEVLSDRIAILQQGQLRCCGSPSYLRETYGQGHSLTLIKKIPFAPQTAHLDNAKGAESAYISLTGASRVCGASLVLAQIVAILMKRFHHARRDWRGSLSNVLLPVVFVALAMALFSVKPLAIDYPSLKLTPRLYKNWLSTNAMSNYCINLLGINDQTFTLTFQAFFRSMFGFNPFLIHNFHSLFQVWYNQKGFHSLPSYLNELNNLILWLNLPPAVDWRQYGITLYSQPYGGALLHEDKIMENVRQCGVALCIMLGFSILTASIGSAVVKDRVSGTKRLQHITGLGYKTYWFANFCWDMLFYMVPVTLCVGVVIAFQLSAFTCRKNLAATVLLLVLFGYATLPWMYLVSRFFSSSDVAFISYISLNFVFGLCTMLVTLLPRLLAIISKVQSFQYIYNILKWTFIIFPQFCLGQGLIELSYNQIKFDLTNNFGIDSYVSPFEMNFLGWIFLEMALQGTVLLLLRLFFHWDLLQKSRGHCSVNSIVSPSEDIDVEMERQRLFGERTGNDILLLYNLRKCYGGFSKKNIAVENISLGIPRGECFGLLGTNGAGKSTTFKMLTGDIIPSAGRAVIRTPAGSELDILSANSEGILIGYCPQHDALDELLTGWEHLYYYCILRGIPKQHICKVAEDLVNRLHLNAHVDKLVRTYSAGTKRKLSTAVALVGKPQILLLDEPSSGMDPCSKRYLWKTILKEVQDGCAAVLTSHSMEECEALCTRLAIMVNGSFKCLGSPQHIKNRFGDGYSVKIWLNKEISSQRMILECLQLHFPGAQFKGQHLNLLEYHIPRSEGCLAELFRVLENHKDFLQIKHYSMNQTTLEQVFINFATQQQGTSPSSQEPPIVRQDHLPV